MQILAFDSATTACSAALWRNGDIAAYRFEPMARGHAEHLMGMVRAVMADSGVAFADLDLLAVTRGPGGFTGLRIGLAAARGLALAGGLDCLGISTLDAVAAGVGASEGDGARVLAAIDSKRGDIYAQVFSGAQPVTEAQAVQPENLADYLNAGKKDGPVVVVGDAAARAVAALGAAGVTAVASVAPSAPDARTVAAMAAARWPAEIPAGALRPLYLRPPDAIVPRNGGRIRP